MQTGAGINDGAGLAEVRNLECRLIQDAIAEHGSQRKAAVAFGISQSTISRKLKES